MALCHLSPYKAAVHLRRGVGCVECFRKFPLMHSTDCRPSHPQARHPKMLLLPPVAPDDLTPYRAKFGPVSERSAGMKTAMRKPLIGIEISRGISDASRKVRKQVRDRRVGILGKKKGLTNLALVGLWRRCWLS